MADSAMSEDRPSLSDALRNGGADPWFSMDAVRETLNAKLSSRLDSRTDP